MPNPRPFSVSDFDPARICWGVGGSDDIGIDPRHTQFVVHLNRYPPEGWPRLFDEPNGETGMLHATAQTENEFTRLERPGIALPPERFYIGEREPDGWWHSYQYATRLQGRPVDPTYAPHHPYLLALGRAQLDYLAETPFGGPFMSEAIPLHQYTLGTPYFKRHHKPRVYLHDTEEAGMAVREVPGVESSVDRMTYATAIRTITQWAVTLPPTPERDHLLERASALLAQSP